ncbi:transposase [Propionibacterium acidifaciens]|uniref:transposase n=1 Tax=Propionibacterium acidifaciens TaxID=556499 RepID=UPI0028E4E655|nr:transposase [Propionibacterium acidifaciens]
MVPDRGESEHRADDPRAGTTPTRNRDREDRGRLDNARPHHAKALTALYEPGQLLERITPVFLPPYAPDHNPVEHIWNAAKNNIADIQHETPEETFGAFASYIASRAFDYDFEHLPPRETRNDFVS